MAWSVERKIAVGFAAALSGLIALGVLSYHQMSDLIDADQWVSHTHEVLTGLARISLELTRAETSQRGYLIGQDPASLDGYAEAVQNTNDQVDHVAFLTSDNPNQIANFKVLRPMVRERLDTLQTNLELGRQSGLAAVATRIKQGHGELKMRQIGGQLETMQNEEYRLLTLRTARSRQSARLTFLLFALAAVLELSLLGVVYRLMRRDLQQRSQAEAEQREIAGQLRLAGEQLSRSNRELQDFASVASHDLQEPLRKIQAFGDRLKVKCGPALSTDGLDYLNRMQNAAGRMQALINDLLSFSRVTTKAQPFIQVSLEQVVREVLIDLEARLEQMGGRVEVGPLPTLQGDPMQMRQLMQNLIGNAIKFHKPGEHPLVKIYQSPTQSTAADRSGEPRSVTINVQDHGIGFDIKYLDRIFTVFQRLHGRSEFEGTGVGLAVCRKIVQRHGGSITADSEPGVGSTFKVVLPYSHDVDDNGRGGSAGSDGREVPASVMAELSRN